MEPSPTAAVAALPGHLLEMQLNPSPELWEGWGGEGWEVAFRYFYCLLEFGNHHPTLLSPAFSEQ